MSSFARLWRVAVALAHFLAAGVVWFIGWVVLSASRHAAMKPLTAFLAVGPPLAFGLLVAAWFLLLGVWTWRERPGWRAALRRTHAVVLGLGVLQLALGAVAIRGAERSAAHGGGLLGGLGEIQVGIAVGLLLLAFASLLAASGRPEPPP